MLYIRNSSGMALIVALIVAFIILALGGMALYISTESTKISGSFKQYKSSIEAALGAYNETDRIIRLLNTSNSVVTYPDSSVLVDKNINCLKDKLKNPVDQWNGIASNTNNNGCPSLSKMKSTKIEDVIGYYDFKYRMGNYNVYVKVVSSTEGNTNRVPESGRTVGGTTANKKGANVIYPPHIPFLYRIEIVSESVVNPNDKALISLLYGF